MNPLGRVSTALPKAPYPPTSMVTTTSPPSSTEAGERDRTALTVLLASKGK